MDFLLKQEEISGTFLDEVANVTPEEIAALGQELEELPVPEGITVLGEMTELEKKIQTLINKKEQMLREKIDADAGVAFFAMLGIAGLDDDDSDVDSLSKTLREIGNLKDDTKFLRSLLGLLMFGRLGLKGRISIRAGFKVTQVVEDKEDRDDECSQSEECAACPGREFCPIAG